MQSAVPVGVGAMSALLGAEIELAEEAAAEAIAEKLEANPVCVVANDNAPGQVVISGTKATVARAGEIAKAKGAKRAMALAVSAPFHCPLMQPPPIKWPSAGRHHHLARRARRWWPMLQRLRIPSRKPSAAFWWNRSRAGCAGAKVCLHSGSGRGYDRGSWRRQGADRHGQAHRQRASDDQLDSPADIEAFAKTL